MSNLLSIILLQLAALIGIAGSPDSTGDLEGVLKIAKYATWPAEAQQMRIMMAAQNSESFSQAQQFLKKQNLDDRPIALVPYSQDCDLSEIMIIYIEKQSGIDVEQLTDRLTGLKILTITNDISNLDKGCMFYIEPKDDMLDYKFNKQAVINSGLMIKGSVLAPYHCYIQE